jgi:S1-C subfamily serine protease|tara:strand:+ start:1332 stop:2030 length:699 start_codon:yes stop_codon:yes gene_type:complete
MFRELRIFSMISITLLLLGSAIAACSVLPRVPLVSSGEMDQVKRSVFVIEGLVCGKNSLGTGVLVQQGVLTNAHVVAGSETLKVIDSDGREFSSFVLAIDFQTDLALLDSSGITQEPLQTSKPRLDMDVVLIVGSGTEIQAIHSEIKRLIDISIADIYGDGSYVRSGMELSADVAPGDSGGPIVNTDEEVIGLVFSRSTNNEGISYGISSEEFEKVTSQPSEIAVETGDCRN